MPLTIILQAIIAALQFPTEILKVVAALKKTPEENHQALIASIEAEAAKFEQTGRPS